MATIRLTKATVHKMIDTWAEVTGEAARLVHFDDASLRSNCTLTGNFFIGRRCYEFVASISLGENAGEYGNHVREAKFSCEERLVIPVDYALWMATAAASEKVTSNG